MGAMPIAIPTGTRATWRMGRRCERAAPVAEAGARPGIPGDGDIRSVPAARIYNVVQNEMAMQMEKKMTQ
jgi:hypothetical protein